MCLQYYLSNKHEEIKKQNLTNTSAHHQRKTQNVKKQNSEFVLNKNQLDVHFYTINHTSDVRVAPVDYLPCKISSSQQETESQQT